MDEGPFGLAKVFFPPVALRVVAQMDVVTPELFQQLIAGPTVVGLGHALGIAVAAPALEPERCGSRTSPKGRQGYG